MNLFNFGRKITPQSLTADLRQMRETMETEIAEAKFKSVRLKKRIEAILKGGTEAASRGDTLGKRQAALELKNAQLLAAKQEKRMLQAIDTQTCIELKLQDLEHYSEGQLGKVCESLSRTMKTPEFKRIMGEVNFGADERDAQIVGALDRAFGELREEQATYEIDTSIFDDLAEAVRNGEEEEILAIKRRVGAEAEAPDPATEEPMLG